MPLPNDWREFIESLNSHRVEYVIVGALALAHHGAPRYTGDLDIFVRSSPGNAERLESALQQFGLGALGLSASDFLVANRVIQLGVPPLRIDLLTSLTGVTFDEAWVGRIETKIEGLPLNFIGREELIRNKRAADRPRDRADLHALGAE